MLLDSLRIKTRSCALHAKGHTTSLSAIPTRQIIHRSFRQTSCLSERSTLPYSTSCNLQTARVRIVGPTGLSKFTRCVLDSGSQTSFVNTSIIDALKLDVIGQQNLAMSAFESSSITSRSRRLVRLDLRGIWTNSSTIITAFESAYEF
jgi:hypothetical protein